MSQGAKDSHWMRWWTTGGVIVALLVMITGWLQPSANSYEQQARDCSSSMKDVQAAVGDLASIPVRMNDDPINISALVAEANRFAAANGAVQSNCPLAEKVEYVNLADSSTYRGHVRFTNDCTKRALERAEIQCSHEDFVRNTQTVVACAYSIIRDADAVTKWPIWKQWEQVVHRWKESFDKTADSQVFDSSNIDELLHACDITDPNDPSKDWGGF